MPDHDPSIGLNAGLMKALHQPQDACEFIFGWLQPLKGVRAIQVPCALHRLRARERDGHGLVDGEQRDAASSGTVSDSHTADS